MAQCLPLSHQISIGGQPDESDLRTMAAEGVRSLVNLVPAGENPNALSPEEEGRLARQLGMDYLYIPVPASDIRSPQRVDEFLKGLKALPRPVLVHCAAGKRAGVYAAIALGVELMLSGDSALKHVRQLGFDPGPGDLADFIRDQTDEYQEQTLRG